MRMLGCVQSGRSGIKDWQDLLNMDYGSVAQLLQTLPPKNAQLDELNMDHVSLIRPKRNRDSQPAECPEKRRRYLARQRAADVRRHFLAAESTLMRLFELSEPAIATAGQAPQEDEATEFASISENSFGRWWSKRKCVHKGGLFGKWRVLFARGTEDMSEKDESFAGDMNWVSREKDSTTIPIAHGVWLQN